MQTIADEALGDDGGEGVRDHPRLDAEVDQAHDRLHRARGVKRREDEVPGERGLQRDRRRLGVADLADEDDVGVLAQDRAQPRREGEARARVGLSLVDRRDVDLDGVLQRHHVHARRVEELHERVERRRLARPGRTARHHEALGPAHDVADARTDLRVEPELLEPDQLLPEEQAEHDLLAEDAGEARGAQVDPCVRGGLHRELPVLREAPLGDVHPGENLHPRHDLGRDVRRERAVLDHRAVDPEADEHPIALRLEVDVARPLDRGAPHDLVEQDDDVLLDASARQHPPAAHCPRAYASTAALHTCATSAPEGGDEGAGDVERGRLAERELARAIPGRDRGDQDLAVHGPETNAPILHRELELVGGYGADAAVGVRLRPERQRALDRLHELDPALGKPRRLRARSVAPGDDGGGIGSRAGSSQPEPASGKASA